MSRRRLYKHLVKVKWIKDNAKENALSMFYKRERMSKELYQALPPDFKKQYKAHWKRLGYDEFSMITT